MNSPKKKQMKPVYLWVAERPVAVAFAALAIGIIASFFITRSEVSDVGTRVTKVESPCLRYGPKSDQCKEAFEAAVATITHPEACAIERKAGTLKAIRELAAALEVNFKEPCAGARLAQERQRGSERKASARGAASTQRGGFSGGPVEAAQPGSGGPGGTPPGKDGSGGGSGPPTSGSEGGGEQGSAGAEPTEVGPEGVQEPSRGEPVLPAAVDATGKTVTKTGEAVAGVIEGTKTACALSPNC